MKRITLLSASILLAMPLCACDNGANPKASVTSWEVPEAFRVARSDSQGQIETLEYVTSDYAEGTDKKQTKALHVYVPYGYDENQRYDILYLLHGTDKQSVDHISTWFHAIGIKNILDNLIYYQQIRPLLVVTPTFYSYGLYGDDDASNIKEMTPVKRLSSANFPDELRYDIIPTVEEHYSTYATSLDESGFQASREHRAMAGLSNGARITLNGGIIKNFDYFASFGVYSSSVDAATILQALDQPKFASLPLKGFFNATGIYDFAYNAQKKMYDALLQDERFNSRNSRYFKVNFGYHSARSWRVGLYDSLPYFFAEGQQ